MICPDCQRTCDAYPCMCGYGEAIKGSQVDGRPASWRTYTSQPFGITKEEFGVLLYDTIQTIGGILGLDQQRAVALRCHESKKVETLLERRRVLQRTLAGQLPKLTEKELDQILAVYPWIVDA